MTIDLKPPGRLLMSCCVKSSWLLARAASADAQPQDWRQPAPSLPTSTDPAGQTVETQGLWTDDRWRVNCRF